MVELTAANQGLLKVSYVLNRWLKMLNSYSQLDAESRAEDLALLSKVVMGAEFSNAVRKAVRRCRDYALMESVAQQRLIAAIESALKVLRDEQEDASIRRVKKQFADQGMTERYRPLSKRLAHEKIRKIGKKIAFTDAHADDGRTTKLVRRIVEKRAAQAAFRNSGASARADNRLRQAVRRAISFNLYNSGFADFDLSQRTHATHWKVVDGKHGKKMKRKHAYNSYEAAAEACRLYALHRPGDPLPMSAYRCAHCGKWHIGHDRAAQATAAQAAS